MKPFPYLTKHKNRLYPHYFLQTPQVKPSFAQRLQYLQSLQALHGLYPLQVSQLQNKSLIF